MAQVYIPAQMRDLTGGVDRIEIAGSNLRRIIAGLESAFPGIKDRLVSGDAIASGLAVSIDGNVSTRGLLAPVGEISEVHFLPAIGGG